jgi:hypothetical protein
LNEEEAIEHRKLLKLDRGRRSHGPCLLSGAGVVIASQSGHRLPPLTVEQNKALATAPVEELLSLTFLQLDKVTDSLHAYQLSKRGNSLRVMAEAVRWGKRGARGSSRQGYESS